MYMWDIRMCLCSNQVHVHVCVFYHMRWLGILCYPLYCWFYIIPLNPGTRWSVRHCYQGYCYPWILTSLAWWQTNHISSRVLAFDPPNMVACVPPLLWLATSSSYASRSCCSSEGSVCSERGKACHNIAGSFRCGTRSEFRLQSPCSLNGVTWIVQTLIIWTPWLPEPFASVYASICTLINLDYPSFFAWPSAGLSNGGCRLPFFISFSLPLALTFFPSSSRFLSLYFPSYLTLGLWSSYEEYFFPELHVRLCFVGEI